MKKLEKALISISNLAIPPNEKLEKGLGDLIESNSSNIVSDLTKTFLNKNCNFLVKIYKYLNKPEVTYKIFVENIYRGEDHNDAKYFLEEFRVFAIKSYFSHPYTIMKLNLFEKFKYNKIDIEKDNLILNSLIGNNKNDSKE